MGRGFGSKGYNARWHTEVLEDAQLQNAVREKIERLVHDPHRMSEVIHDVWQSEKQMYKRYCQMYGVAMVKLRERGEFRLEKVDGSQHPFVELCEILTECTGGGKMEIQTLLWHVKDSEPDLWKKLTVKGITNCSPKKLMSIEEEVRQYFDISPDWWYIAPRGAIAKEYAKPLLLRNARHGAVVRRALQASRSAVKSVQERTAHRKAKGPEMFCAFAPRERQQLDSSAARVLAQREESSYQRMLPARERLPAYKQRAELLAAYEAHNVLVVCGATGCGKTTQLPQFLMEVLAEVGGGRVLCTQPRRISATSVAERVAHERGEALGESVGYQIRFEHRAGPETALLYCTVGILLRHMAGNPTLDGVALVVVDEVHERDVHTDFALLILRDLVAGPRPDLKLVLMSATIDASTFIEYFQIAGKSGEAIRVGYTEIPGKTNFPIEEYWAEDILRDVLPQYTPAGPPPPRRRPGASEEPLRNAWASEPGAVARRLPGEADHVCQGISNMLRRPLNKVDVQLVTELVAHIDQHLGEGSILIFAPGWQEIADIVKDLERRAISTRGTWRLFPLHSMVPPSEQQLIFEVLPPGERKIIVSTNIAETSITVEDVVFVIDTGLLKATQYTPKTNVASLETQLVSRSNVQQRRGRAGRCRPGKLFKLYSRLEWEDNMTDSLTPEMQRTPVEELCLQVRALQLPGPIASTLGKALAPPSSLAVANAVSLLRALGALDGMEDLTTLGWKLSAMPLHPSLGKMLLLGSLFGCVPELLSVCATLSAKSPFVLPFGKEREADEAKHRMGRGLCSDHLLYAKVSSEFAELSQRQRGEWCQRNFLSDKTLQMIQSLHRDLRRYLDEMDLGENAMATAENLDFDDEARAAELMAVLSASLPLASRLPSEKKFRCLDFSGLSCSVHPSSLLEGLSSPKQQRSSQQGEDYSLLCWFSRMRTADLYLHDCSLVHDMLPLLLLSPHVKRRSAPQGNIYEVRWPAAPLSDADDAPAELAARIPGQSVAPLSEATASHVAGSWDDNDDSEEEAVLLTIPAMVDVDAATCERYSTGARPTLGETPDSWEDAPECSEFDLDDLTAVENPPATGKEKALDPTQHTATANTQGGTAHVSEGASSGSSDEDACSSPARPARPVHQSQDQRALLLQIADTGLADLLWELRFSLQELVDLIIGEPPFRLPEEVGRAFTALRELLLQSYELHRDDPSVCTVISAPRAVGIDLEIEAEGTLAGASDSDACFPAQCQGMLETEPAALKTWTPPEDDHRKVVGL